jgi:GxxExxY protein
MRDYSEVVIGAAFDVAITLGTGYLEKVYEQALVADLRLKGVRAETQVRFPVVYKGINVGDYFADIVVEGQLLVETKCVDQLAPLHMAQCLNYLRRPTVEWKRVLLGTHDKATLLT